MRHSAATILAVAALLAIVQFASLPATPRILGVLNNFAHGPVFGTLALVVLFWLRRRRPARAWHAYAIALLVSAAAGLALEVLQIYSRRDASLGDVLANILGAGSFLCIAAYFDRSLWQPPARPSARLPVLIAGGAQLLTLLLPVGEALLAYAARASQYPTLMQFASARDLYFIEQRGCEITLTESPAGSDESVPAQALRIRFLGDDWPGIFHFEPSPDWRPFSQLRIDVTNPGEAELVLGLRIDDRGHGLEFEDRFNAEFPLAAATRQVISVPLADIQSGPAGRQLDLSRVGGIALFRIAPQTEQAPELILTRVWLE